MEIDTDKDGTSFTLNDVHGTIRVGDTFTIAGLERRNPDWHWWAFWRPKFMPNELLVFRVVSA